LPCPPPWLRQAAARDRDYTAKEPPPPHRLRASTTFRSLQRAVRDAVPALVFACSGLMRALHFRSESASGLGHSITRSACSRSDFGIVRPSLFAVLRLMTSSNFVGCSTGKSAGLAPFKILSTLGLAQRYAHLSPAHLHAALSGLWTLRRRARKRRPVPQNFEQTSDSAEVVRSPATAGVS
jgi:hypothetical protein